MATQEQILIEKINAYLIRIENLAKHVFKNGELEDIQEHDIEKMLQLREINHWDFIKNNILNSLDSKDYKNALIMVNIALKHLKYNTTWTLSDKTAAFSNKELLSDIMAKIPVIGTFFPILTRKFHQDAMDKTEERLKQINEWLNKLEKHFNPSFISIMKNIFK